MRNMTTWYGDKCKIEILYLLKHDEILLEECFERNTLVTSSGTKNSINSPIGGIGLVLPFEQLVTVSVI